MSLNFRMQATFDSNPPSLAVSSRSECILQRLQKSGKINYSYGSNDISATEQQLLGEEQQQLSHIQQGVIAQYVLTNSFLFYSFTCRLYFDVGNQ